MAREHDEEAIATKAWRQNSVLTEGVILSILGIPDLNNANEHAAAAEQCSFWVTNEILDNTTQWHIQNEQIP